MLTYRVIAKALPRLVLAMFLSGVVAGQGREPDAVFKPAIEEIRFQTRIPILLPTKLPSRIRERDIKLAVGEIRNDGHFISLYFADPGDNANYAAGFGASLLVFRTLPNTRPLALAGGRTGIFRPVSCGGSCAPANLWWEQNRVMYQIQINLRINLNEKEQRRILVETANASVPVPR
jgi:hypothetical protein